MPMTPQGPVYTGMTLHPYTDFGFAIWMPSDWFEVKLKARQKGILYSPYKDDINTSLLLRKYTLKVKVAPDDLPTLRESFQQGVQTLPGVEDIQFGEALSDTISLFDAHFTFLEGEARRKRWVRNIYWGEGQLLIIAQGRTPEDFDYWVPMFYNSIMTLQIV